ncbi:hypothetical protein IQ07DRAFT_18007 [Pyrenochaeta sp. DS3sAY3a]|nr:hypothetical protein IQ07DRAFT_18007 [Pyrenochaeta sp. DS3sAY3a]
MPGLLTKSPINLNGNMQRFQQDLLILSSLNDNQTLLWRPPWFKQEPFSGRFWTLHNPPNVVTERINSVQGRQYFTRRGRQDGDAPPAYIKTWAEWKYYCELYGVPEDLFCKDHIFLLRLGLPKTKADFSPPSYPLYPEPPSVQQGSYVLDPSTYTTHLPTKFRCVDHTASSTDTAEVVVVHADGTLSVMLVDQFLEQKIKQLRLDYPGHATSNVSMAMRYKMLKPQGPGKRWSYIPWTEKQEVSCQPLKLKFRSMTPISEQENEGQET